MHKRTLKKLALALTLWLALHTSVLRAQLLALPSTSPIVEVDSNGLFWDIGSSGSLSSSLGGTGTQMFWYPGKAAFRAGSTDSSSEWNNANIGQYSVGLGWGTIASGRDSFAMGYESQATQQEAVALGGESIASGADSIAEGLGCVASGGFSVSMGRYNLASNDYAVAFGALTTASGYTSMATGWDTIASGDYSLANGYLSQATGFASFANGSTNDAFGDYSSASGYFNVAWAKDAVLFGHNNNNRSFGSLVIGQYNVSLSETAANSNLTSWVATDPAFEIGNGTGYSATSDALVVYKNGDGVLQGTLKVAPSTDIPMYNP